MTAEQKEQIDALNQEEMARLWRFAPSGHPFFSDKEAYDYFTDRFRKLGGFSAAISKRIGF
jgi:ABC-type Zn2+ transport system substrate-binding protein/surface adhesin